MARRAVLVLVLSASAAVASAQPAQRQLVMPFESATRDPQAYWLGEGSSVVLTDALLAMGAPAITREERLRAFARLRVPPVAMLSHATVIRVGELVGATRVVIGTFEIRPSSQAGGQDLIVRARPIQLDTGRMLPPIVESGPLGQLVEIYGRVARRLVPDRRRVTEPVAPLQPAVGVLEQYVKGLVAQTPATRVSFLTQAIRRDPAFTRARLALWQVHTDATEHLEALAAVRDVPPGDPLWRRARFLTGVSMLHLGRHDQAFDEFSQLRAGGTDAALLNNLGVVQLRRPAGSPGGRAVSYFAEATTLDGADPDLFFNLGYAFWLERERIEPANRAASLQSAAVSLREAVRRNPADDAAHYVLGVVLQAMGSAVEATREKELARRLSSEYALWEARQAEPNSAPRRLERIKTEFEVPASSRVESIIVAAEQRDQRELAAFHLQAGKRAFEAERDGEAIAALRRAIYLAPYQSEAHLMLGRAYMRSGRIDEAIDALKIAIWSEDTVAARLVLAEALIQRRDVEAARGELQWILKADPQHRDARRLLERIQ